MLEVMFRIGYRGIVPTAGAAIGPGSGPARFIITAGRAFRPDSVRPDPVRPDSMAGKEDRVLRSSNRCNWIQRSENRLLNSHGIRNPVKRVFFALETEKN